PLYLVSGASTPATCPVSLHAALPIFRSSGTASSRDPPSGGTSVLVVLAARLPAGGEAGSAALAGVTPRASPAPTPTTAARRRTRSEEHTSELQSRENLVCRLLLEKKK